MLPTMELVPATADEVFERDASSHAEWGAGLPVAAHQARERTLRGGAWPREALRAWFLKQLWATA